MDEVVTIPFQVPSVDRHCQGYRMRSSSETIEVVRKYSC